MYGATQMLVAKSVFNRHTGGQADQLAALVAHIERLDRKQRNAVARGDHEQACKHERLIAHARIQIVALSHTA